MDSFFDKFFYRKRFKKIVKYIPKDSVICDLGCGKEAYFLKNIANSIKRGIGLDAKVENYKNSKLELRRFEIEKTLPLENESCDIITMAAVVEHLLYPQEVLNESSRILKNGGRLILTTPTPISKPILEILAKLRLIDKNEIRDHKNYFWPKAIKKMLLKSGFSEENIKNYFFEFFLNNLIIAQK